MAKCVQINSKDLEINSHCAVCGVSANSKCAACTLVVYCSKKHQKDHWKQHKNECVSYEVIKNYCNLNTKSIYYLFFSYK